MSLADRMTSDLGLLFKVSEWAKSLTITPQDGVPKTIIGLFDAPFEAVSVLTGSVELTSPQATVKTADTVDLRHGDWLEVGATAYRIVGIQPDGTGVTVLRLSTDVST